MAQEDRELQRMLPKNKFQIDWITFQPFEEYFPKLQQLREQSVNNPLRHMKEISQLSAHVLRLVGVLLASMALLAFSGVDPYFQPVHLFVVAMVFLQAFIIVYFVHWQWNRFDLSFDAVVKYFASGFLLCTANALIYETIVSNILTGGALIISLTVMALTRQLGDLEDVSTVDDINSSSSGDYHAAYDYARKAAVTDNILHLLMAQKLQ